MSSRSGVGEALLTAAETCAARGLPPVAAGVTLLRGFWQCATGQPLPESLAADLFPALWLDAPAGAVSTSLEATQLPALVQWCAALRVDNGRATLDRRGRRRHGVYYTPEWLVDMVLDAVLAGLSGPVRVLDPACGAGAFLLAAGRRGCTVSGIDDDPLAVLACRIILSLAGLAPAASLGDALLDDLGMAYDAVVGNPPWGVAYDRRARARLRAAGRQLDPGEPCSATLFLRRAAELVRPGGRIGLILPESWLCTKRAGPLRRWLCDETFLEEVIVLRKGVFDAAPDMVPTVVILQATPPSGQPVRVRCAGWRDPLPPTRWRCSVEVTRHAWRREPYWILPTGIEPELADLWARLGGLPRLGDGFTIHDGIYRTTLTALLGRTGRPALIRAAEVTRYCLRPRGGRLPEPALARLSAREVARQTAPKILVHAMRKPALADRIVAAADPEGRVVCSNNFMLLVPRGDCRWDLHAVTALLNSRLLNRWHADRFVSVNIEAFALAALPVPAAELSNGAAWARLARLGRAAAAGATVDDEIEAWVDRLYGLTAEERAAVDRRWNELR